MNLSEEITRWQGMHQQLLGLAQGCLRVVEQNRLEDLDDLWAKRRRAFDRLEAAARRLAPAFADWPASAAALSPGELGRAQGMIKQVRDIAGQVLQIDRQVAAGLQAAKERAGGEIKRLNDGRRLMDAYGQSAYKGPLHLSKLG